MSNSKPAIFIKVLLVTILAFGPTLAAQSIASASGCLQPHQVQNLTTPAPNADGSPNVQTITTCGGDDVSYQIPLSGPVVFDGVTFNSLFVTTNSVIAFGAPDGTFHDFPMTPSISLFSQDWVAYPTHRTDEAFTIAHSHQGFQVTLKVRPFGNQGTPTLTTIVFTASYKTDRSLDISYYANNVDQYQTRTGVRLNNGTVVPFEQAGIVEEEEVPVVPGEPEPDPAPTISETVAEDGTITVYPQMAPNITPNNWVYEIRTTQQNCLNPYNGQTINSQGTPSSITFTGLTNGCEYTIRVMHSNGTTNSRYVEVIAIPVAPFIEAPTDVQATLEGNTITITWDAPTEFTVPIERYAIFWSYDNFQTGYAISSTTTSATITVPYDVTVSIKVRADNDSEVVFSDFSQPVVVIVPPAPVPPPTPPVIPEGADTAPEGTDLEINAPEGKRIASIIGYYGDPTDGTRGIEVSSILAELANGLSSVVISVSNDTFGEDPALGTTKILIYLVTYEDVPTPEPSPSEPEPTPTPIGPETPNPTPTPTPTPEPPVNPTPEPTTPTEPVTPVEPTPEPTRPPVVPIPQPPTEPTTEPTEEPKPTPNPEEPKPALGQLPENITPEALLEVDLTIIIATDLTPEQAEALEEAALEILKTAEQGSPEYEQALDALFLAAQQDDIVLDESLASIPLLGDVLGGAVELVNFLGNAGSDMSPAVRETSEEIVVAAVIVAQISSVVVMTSAGSTGGGVPAGSLAPTPKTLKTPKTRK